jgi:methylase of polypeptide subunit release factors
VGKNTTLEQTLKHYAIGGLELELETSPTVFYPTSTSNLIAGVLEVPTGSRVLDVGCGVGVLAIYAALKGAGHVAAVDIMPEACEYARLNADKNNVGDKVSVFQGDLFDPLPSGKYDVIIDDVSGIADEVARLSSWFPDPVPTGGPDGTKHVVAMLDRVKDYLTERGVLYLPIASLSNAKRILHTAGEIFGGKIEQLTQVHYPFGPGLKEHVEKLEQLRGQGLIDFTTRKSRHFWSLTIYRAWV